MFSPLLAIWPFINPIMLGWLAAAAAPVLIHLLSRRRYREETWAAMQFLIAAVQKNSRRIRLEQWILLALRTLILLLLAMALAEPVLGPLMSVGERLRGGVTHWVLVLDASYSMDYRDDGETLFDQAKELAAKLARDSTQGDGFTLVLMSEPPTVVIREPAFDPSDVIRELEVLSVRHGGADLGAALAEVDELIENASGKHARLRRTEVCIFSDLGRTTWDTVESGPLRRRVAALAENAQLRLFDLGRDGRENAAVVRLRAEEPVMTPGREIRFAAEVQKFRGGESRRRIQFLVDGRRVGDETVNLTGEEPASVSFAHRFAGLGPHAVEVRLDDDNLPLDDRRWLSVRVRPAVRVLCVEGKPGAAKYVALALAPQRGDRSPILPEIASEPDLLERELGEYDCLFLCNIGRMGREEANVLRNYLGQGGAVVVFLGDQVQADSYNTWLGPRDDQPTLLPARIGRAKQDNAQYGFNPLDYRHPLVASFRGHEQAGLLTTPVWKYFELAPYEALGPKIALGFDGGGPAIVEAPVLRGRVILCATAASTASTISGNPPSPWTAWSTWPSFPPVIQDMLRLAVTDRMASRNLVVGEPIQGAVAVGKGSGAVTLSGPARADQEPWRERIPLTQEGDFGRWSFSQTQWSGLYHAEYGGDVPAQPFAVNVNPSEGQLTRVDPALMPSQFERDDRSDESNDEELVEDPQQPYFRHLLVLMGVCMLLETGLAWYFGNRSA